MTEQTKNQTTQRQSDSRRVVFDSENIWEGPAGWFLVVLLLLAGVAAIGYVYRTGWEGKQAEVTVPAQVVEDVSVPDGVITGVELRAYDGVPAEDGDDLFGVMIDNISLARPAAGINSASLVIECLAEGAITRLLAFFPTDTDIERIGPVRSARPYFVDWATEYGVAYVHVGGSPDALDQLTSSNLRDLNQFWWGGYFWRDRKRDAPHNTYTSSELLLETLESLEGERVPAENDRPFKTGGPEAISDEITVEELKIDYPAPMSRVVWSHDAELNKYLRYQGRGEFVDEDDVQVAADNIIVQVTDIQVIDSVGRREVRTSGEGQALVFRDGIVIEARWVKEEGDRTRFVAADSDEEIPWNVGTTWIEVVGDMEMVEFQLKEGEDGS
jgi:hypothetical protein